MRATAVFISDLWVRSRYRTQLTAGHKKNYKTIPEEWRTKAYGKRARYRVTWNEGSSTHNKDFKTHEEAKAFQRELIVQSETGEYVGADNRGRLFADVAGEWLDAQRTQKDSTLNRYEAELKRYVLPQWGEWRLEDITPRAIDKWVAALADGTAPANYATHGRKGGKGLAANSIKHILNTSFGGVLKLARQRRYMIGNPLESVAPPRAQANEAESMNALTLEEVEALANGCCAYRDVFRVLVLLLAYTGLRIGEATALQCGDINTDTMRVRVARTWTKDRGGRKVTGTPKTGKARLVPLPSFLLDDVRELMEGQPAGAWLFRVRGGACVDIQNFRNRVFTPTRRALEIVCKIHDLRHTAATHAIAAGADVKVVQTMLGHATATETLNRYGHLWADNLDTVADALAARRAAIVGAV